MCYSVHKFVIKYFSCCDACKLVELNLGNNSLEETPAVPGHLEPLKELCVFGEQITVAPPEAVGGSTLFCMISIVEVFAIEEGEEKNPIKSW